LSLFVFSCTVLFVSISQVIGCEDRLQNDLYCVEWGVKLYFNQQKFVYSRTILYCFPLFPLNQARRFGEHCKLPTLPSEKNENQLLKLGRELNAVAPPPRISKVGGNDAR